MFFSSQTLKCLLSQNSAVSKTLLYFILISFRLKQFEFYYLVIISISSRWRIFLNIFVYIFNILFLSYSLVIFSQFIYFSLKMCKQVERFRAYQAVLWCVVPCTHRTRLSAPLRRRNQSRNCRRDDNPSSCPLRYLQLISKKKK